MVKEMISNKLRMFVDKCDLTHRCTLCVKCGEYATVGNFCRICNIIRLAKLKCDNVRCYETTVLTDTKRISSLKYWKIKKKDGLIKWIYIRPAQ